MFKWELEVAGGDALDDISRHARQELVDPMRAAQRTICDLLPMGQMVKMVLRRRNSQVLRI